MGRFGRNQKPGIEVMEVVVEKASVSREMTSVAEGCHQITEAGLR